MNTKAVLPQCSAQQMKKVDKGQSAGGRIRAIYLAQRQLEARL